MKAVADSGPLIHPAAVSQFELLRLYFSELLVPHLVFQEVVVAGARAAAKQTPPGAAVGSLFSTRDSTRVAPATEQVMSPADASVVALGRENPDHILLADDLAARTAAVALGLQCSAAQVRCHSAGSTHYHALLHPSRLAPTNRFVARRMARIAISTDSQELRSLEGFTNPPGSIGTSGPPWQTGASLVSSVSSRYTTEIRPGGGRSPREARRVRGSTRIFYGLSVIRSTRSTGKHSRGRASATVREPTASNRSTHGPSLVSRLDRADPPAIQPRREELRMADPKQSEPQVPEIKMTSTKKEMLEAYKQVVRQLKEKGEAQVKPQERAEERRKEEAVQVADSLSTEGIAREVGNLRSEVGKVLNDLSDRLEEEIGKYLQVKEAVAARENELQEIFEIEKEAQSLAALLDTQKEAREQFNAEMSEKKQALESEIATKREAWNREREEHAADAKSREAAEKQKREREQEEYTYSFERRKKLAEEQFEYEKAGLERELTLKRAELEENLKAREQAIGEQEAELNELRERVSGFPEELSAAVDKAVQEVSERLTRDAEAREALMKKEHEGEQGVLQSRLEALQQTVKEQQQQISRLSSQIDKSYGQVQDIAVKAIEGSGNLRMLSTLQARAEENRSGQGEREEQG